jgi:hypothetical protein
MIPSWRKVWQEGLAPKFSTKALKKLRLVLLNDDEILQQNIVTNENLSAFCPIGYCGFWMVPPSRKNIERFFADVCNMCANGTIDSFRSAAVFLIWFDSTSRKDAFASLLEEVELTLKARQEVETL